MHNLPPTCTLPEYHNFPGFSEVHSQTQERAHTSPDEKLWPNRDQPAPTVPLWGGCAGCPRPPTRPVGQRDYGLTLSGWSPTISTSFWIIFLQAPQAMPSLALPVGTSPCQEKKPFEAVSQTPQAPLRGPQEGAFGCFQGRQDHL